jgi:hypothetical protein
MLCSFLSLALTLFMARVGANHVQTPMAADQLTVLTNTLDASPNFHRSTSPADSGTEIAETTILTK